MLVEGADFGSVKSVQVPMVKPGDFIDISVSLMAPYELGRHVSHWVLKSNHGTRFGPRVWVNVKVEEGANFKVK